MERPAEGVVVVKMIAIALTVLVSTIFPLAAQQAPSNMAQPGQTVQTPPVPALRGQPPQTIQSGAGLSQTVDHEELRRMGAGPVDPNAQQEVIPMSPETAAAIAAQHHGGAQTPPILTNAVTVPPQQTVPTR